MTVLQSRHAILKRSHAVVRRLVDLDLRVGRGVCGNGANDDAACADEVRAESTPAGSTGLADELQRNSDRDYERLASRFHGQLVGLKFERRGTTLLITHGGALNSSVAGTSEGSGVAGPFGPATLTAGDPR